MSENVSSDTEDTRERGDDTTAQPERSRRRSARRPAGPPPEAPAQVTPPPEAPAADEPPPGGLTAVFQPPTLVFQPPEIPAERSRPEPKRPETTEASDDESAADEASEDTAEGDEAGGKSGRRRRRRGGRGRGKKDSKAEGESQDSPGQDGDGAKSGSQDKPAAEQGQEQQDDGDQSEEGDGKASSRRRRRRRRAGSPDVDKKAPDDPHETVVHVRAGRSAEARAAEDEVQSVKGSTRLEAKKQRRREGREQGRRRPPIITESEFLARRESVERVMVVRREDERTQIAVLEDGVLGEHYVDRASHQSYVGNVYLGKVQNVLPSMEAAFVDIGKGRNAVLYAGEVNWDVVGMEGQPRRIEAALKSGQSVLVQVTKDPLGHKGARLTSQISLPGRYLVYVPDGSMMGISRKLPDKERTRLKQILKKVMPENAGVIVRTAAEGAAEEELSRDVARLAAQWENIKRQAESASAPALLYGEPDLTIRVVRDVFNEDFAKLVVSGSAWDTVEDYVRYVAPHLADRVEQWDAAPESAESGGANPEPRGDVFAAYRVDEQIAKALERKVWLPSGGSLVIDRTEAMTVVDVNTGKFTGQGGNLEETVTRNNLEAAEEIVRQLRLRDLGGIIVIDFIDMVLESNRDLVLRRLLECLARDRTKHQVAEVTSLGLVQMTRKRVGQGLLEAFSESCECCNGRGIHVSPTLTPAPAEKQTGGGRRRKQKTESPDSSEATEAPTPRGKRRRSRSQSDGAVTVNLEAADSEETKPVEARRNGSGERSRRRRARGVPAAATEAPAATTDASAVATGAPAAATEGPGVTAEAPASAPDVPVATTEASVGTSEVPGATTEAPAAAAEATAPEATAGASEATAATWEAAPTVPEAPVTPAESPTATELGGTVGASVTSAESTGSAEGPATEAEVMPAESPATGPETPVTSAEAPTEARAVETPVTSPVPGTDDGAPPAEAPVMAAEELDETRKTAESGVDAPS